MRDLSLIQRDAAERARGERDQRKRQSLASRRMALAEARLANIERLIDRYHLTRLAEETK